jgi:hypothetical protein
VALQCTSAPALTSAIAVSVWPSCVAQCSAIHLHNQKQPLLQPQTRVDGPSAPARSATQRHHDAAGGLNRTRRSPCSARPRPPRPAPSPSPCGRSATPSAAPSACTASTCPCPASNLRSQDSPRTVGNHSTNTRKPLTVRIAGVTAKSTRADPCSGRRSPPPAALSHPPRRPDAPRCAALCIGPGCTDQNAALVCSTGQTKEERHRRIPVSVAATTQVKVAAFGTSEPLDGAGIRAGCIAPIANSTGGILTRLLEAVSATCLNERPRHPARFSSKLV